MRKHGPMPRSPDSDAPRDVLARWALTLNEPLLPLARRRYLEDDLLSVCTVAPMWTSVALGGVLADMVRSLPSDDPWRHLTGRVGTITVGDDPPTEDGARSADGSPFGTWRDGLDLLEEIYSHPSLDPALAAVATDLQPVAAGLIASGSYGWRASSAMIQWLADPTRSPVTDMGPSSNIVMLDTKRPLSAPGGRRVYDAVTAALRWVVWRRRCYMPGDLDTWPGESLYRWGWRADQIVTGGAWDVDDVEPLIAKNNPLA